MDRSAPRPTDMPVFDIARAAAALAVLAAHARSFLLLDVKDQPPLSLVGRLFYGLTALGHQAVIVFFVVSGALVTRSILALDARGQWSARSFAAARLSRLWVVLIPCLLLGGCLDHLGIRLGDHLVYDGHYGALRVTGPAAPIRLDLPTFAGNVVFLQTIVTAPYGTNVPLWSLAAEAWYYLAAFFAFSAWRSAGRPLARALHLAALGLIVTVVYTAETRALALTWMLGAALTLAPRARDRLCATGRGGRMTSLLVLAGALALARAHAVHHLLLGDYAVALATALCLATHARWQPRSRPLGATAKGIAALSYSLYLSHFPLLAFGAAILLRNHRLPFGLRGALLFAAADVAALAYAAAVWWMFERRTPQVRRWLSGARAAPARPALVAAPRRAHPAAEAAPARAPDIPLPTACPRIAVLIACHNRKAKTLACLANLQAQRAAADLTVIVYDDGSRDGTADAIRAAFPATEIIAGSGNAYWAGGMRAAFAHALATGFDFYLWLNDDVELAADAIARLLAAHRSLRHWGMDLCLIGGALIDLPSGGVWYGGITARAGFNPLRFVRTARVPTALERTDTLNGNVVLIPAATAQAVGSIGDAFIHTLADLDYGLRVGQAGGWVGLAPGIFGTCTRNRNPGQWLSRDLSCADRWRIVGTPHGLPLRPWLAFAHRHGGPLWFVFAIVPYWRLFVPSDLLRLLRVVRLMVSQPHRPSHAA